MTNNIMCVYAHVYTIYAIDEKYISYQLFLEVRAIIPNISSTQLLANIC